MIFKFLEVELTYDGHQLHSLFAYRNFEVLGDSVLAWVGSCDVIPDFMVDGEDLNADSSICGDRMAHFIVEKFNCSLFAAVGLQRLLGEISRDVIRELSPKEEITNFLRRKGDDIYFENKKLNISIATQSPTSSLIHFAVNVVNEGTPVETLCLRELEVDERTFVNEVGQRFVKEVKSMERATQKVKWVP